MAEILAIGEIKGRAAAIGVSLKELARSCGIDASTVYSAARGDSDMLARNLASLTAELLRREGQVRAHLERVALVERGAA